MIYTKAPHKFEPGTAFQYNSYHLMLALAMATKTTGLSALEFMRTNLLEPAGMTNTHWDGSPLNLASGMKTTGDDYDSFLQRYTAYELVPEEIASEMEKAHVGNWAMSHERKNGCQQIAGQFRACVNRAKGTYIFVMPPENDYLTPGYGQMWHGPVNEQAIYWIKDQAESLALSA